MRILIMSDSHNKHENVMKVLNNEKHIDMLIHCGDIENGEEEIRKACNCPMVAVKGNNDFFVDLPKEIEMELGSYKVLITHGHYYYVSMENQTIKQEAISREFDIVFYGHSHKPIIDREEEIVAINPGSISYPRQEGKRPSYCIMEIEENEKATFEIRFL